MTGTLQYMSPEQVEGREADTRSDIFALGVVIYEMVDEPPAVRGPIASGARCRTSSTPTLRAPASVVPALSPAFDYFVRSCLCKNPDDRWQSAHDVLLELRDGSSRSGTLAAPPAAGPAAAADGAA